MSLQFTKYLITGALGTLTHYTIMWCLVSMAWSPTIATGMGALSGALINYVFCRTIVFNKIPNDQLMVNRVSTVGSSIRFLVVAALLAVINSVYFYLLFHTTKSIVIAQLLSTAFVLPVGYVMNKRWSFAQTQHTLAGPIL